MLVEFKNVRQEPGKGSRRWFEGNHYELVVWYQPDAVTIDGFQIIYHHEQKERALTWRAGEGFQHGRVDDGTGSPLKNLTPIVLPNGSVPWTEVLREFDENGSALEAGLRDFVRARLEARA